MQNIVKVVSFNFCFLIFFFCLFYIICWSGEVGWSVPYQLDLWNSFLIYLIMQFTDSIN